MFLQDGAIGLQLKPYIINYLNKIREIAIIKNLVLITSNVNIKLITRQNIIVIPIYIGITIMIC